MIHVNDLIDRFCKKSGFVRDKLSDKTADNIKSVNVFVIFGEMASVALFSKTVYPVICKSNDHYNIVLSWNGFEVLFEGIDEFWNLGSSHDVLSFYRKANGIDNNSKNINVILRSLNEVFSNVHTPVEYFDFFKTCVEEKFYNIYRDVNIVFPNLLSNLYIPQLLLEKTIKMPNKKIVIMPFNSYLHWQDGKQHLVFHDEMSYVDLFKNLLAKNYGIICVQNDLTYDLSKNISEENIFFLKESNIQKIITIIHHIGLYLDFFANSAFLGYLAQANTFCVTERNNWFNNKKQQELELFRSNYNCKNYFSFMRSNNSNTYLDNNYFYGIIKHMDEFYKNYILEKKNVIKHKQVNFNDIIGISRSPFHGKYIKVKRVTNNA